jgi:endo-alpha-1,4-polygalactosaminidase (GH114 family)
MRKLLFIAMLCFSVSSCHKDDGVDVVNTIDNTPLPSDKTNWWQPKASTSFDWDLADLTNTDKFTTDVVDVDAYTTSAEQVAELHAQGKKVIAYLSVGTFEKDRPDLDLLPKEIVGKVYPEWPDEKWLDIRQPEKLKPWLTSRFNMIIKKGFDAIEPDNLDSYDNETGFPITIDDTKRYCDYLIQLAHANGLSIGQKNVPDLSNEYASKFDWILTEDAFEQGWQDQVKEYIVLNKPVFAVEYTDNTSQQTFDNSICPKAKALGYYAILKHRDLDKWTYTCK